MSKKLRKPVEFSEGINAVSISRGKDFFSIFVQHTYLVESVTITGEKAVKIFIKKMKEILKDK